jgi:hypothetical protein
VLINGSPTSFFKGTRGLRKCFPLSPLLFVLIVKGLSRAIPKQFRGNKIEGVSVERGIRITHFIFVDDVIILGIGNIIEWKAYKEVLDLFCKLTGMSFSPQKYLFLEA